MNIETNDLISVIITTVGVIGLCFGVSNPDKIITNITQCCNGDMCWECVGAITSFSQTSKIIIIVSVCLTAVGVIYYMYNHLLMTSAKYRGYCPDALPKR